MDSIMFSNLMNQLLELNSDYNQVLNSADEILTKNYEIRYDGKNFKGYVDTIITIEELAELQQALTKALRGKLNSDNILEEVCDVELSLIIIKKIYNITPKKLNKAKYIKLKRLIERTNNGDFK